MILVFIVMAAQFESLVDPFVIMFSIPFAFTGIVLGLAVTQTPLGVMALIGVIMLMGLLAKNAILIVEFALERRRMGMSITWAAVLGAAARLRPILMTSLAMIVGLLPLMFASGAGANGNRTLGTSAIGGMLIGTLALLFITPVFLSLIHI